MLLIYCLFRGACEHISRVLVNDLYEAAAYTIDIFDTTGELSDVKIGSMPEAKNGVFYIESGEAFKETFNTFGWPLY